MRKLVRLYLFEYELFKMQSLISKNLLLIKDNYDLDFFYSLSFNDNEVFRNIICI